MQRQNSQTPKLQKCVVVIKTENKELVLQGNLELSKLTSMTLLLENVENMGEVDLLMREQLFENAKQLAVDTGIPQIAITYRTIRESVIDRREAQVKAERAAQPKTEFTEELDLP